MKLALLDFTYKFVYLTILGLAEYSLSSGGRQLSETDCLGPIIMFLWAHVDGFDSDQNDEAIAFVLLAENPKSTF